VLEEHEAAAAIQNVPAMIIPNMITANRGRRGLASHDSNEPFISRSESHGEEIAAVFASRSNEKPHYPCQIRRVNALVAC